MNIILDRICINKKKNYLQLTKLYTISLTSPLSAGEIISFSFIGGVFDFLQNFFLRNKYINEPINPVADANIINI